MLIYNFQKEFLGIDEKDLKTLGFDSLSELRNEVTDFADLFVKTPGYVHNFKHVHWIDFVNYANTSEESKVLININSKTFKATLSVSTLFLIDNVTAPAYMIYLNNLRPLSASEKATISNEVLDRKLPKVEHQESKVFISQQESTPPPIIDEYDKPLEVNVQEPMIEESNNIPEPIPEVHTPVKEETTNNYEIQENSNDLLNMDELSLDVFEETQKPQETIPTPTPAPKVTPAPQKEVEKPILETPVTTEQESSEEENNYKYDPQIASKELGLPLDLIEEFIQDFIDQAKEFKSEIYTAIEEGDIDAVKVLSHKLKGVAANLRVEDAHEVLTNVSSTSDMNVIHENLNRFYKIISKLAGETPEESVQAVQEDEKVELFDINDDESDKIEIPELNENSDEDEKIDIFDINDEIESDKIEIPELTNHEEDEKIEIPELNLSEDEPKKEEKIELFDIEDDDVPLKIEMPELADDDFLDVTIEDETKELPELEPELKFSKADAAKKIGIDEESFNELFNDFILESNQLFQTITEALNNSDLETVKKEALKFKGMSDNMRFTEFSDELTVLIQNSDEETLKATLNKIDSTLKKITKLGA
jgi:HPt (histidine-containing phosphotransfer) domain-containing protein